MRKIWKIRENPEKSAKIWENPEKSGKIREHLGKIWKPDEGPEKKINPKINYCVYLKLHRLMRIAFLLYEKAIFI